MCNPNPSRPAVDAPYEVIDLSTGESLGYFATIEEAEGRALYGPRAWQIWQGATLVDWRDPDALVCDDRLGALRALVAKMRVIIGLNNWLRAVQAHCAESKAARRSAK